MNYPEIPKEKHWCPKCSKSVEVNDQVQGQADWVYILSCGHVPIYLITSNGLELKEIKNEGEYKRPIWL